MDNETMAQVTDAMGGLVRALTALMAAGPSPDGDDYNEQAIGGRLASGEAFDGEFVWGNGWCGVRVTLKQGAP